MDKPGSSKHTNMEKQTLQRKSSHLTTKRAGEGEREDEERMKGFSLHLRLNVPSPPPAA